MQCVFRLMMVVATVCFLSQIPMSAMAKEAVKMKPGNIRTTAAIKTLPPDLVVSKITYSTRKPTAGSELQIKVFFKNVGRNRAEASIAHVRVGGESIPKTVNVPALNIGQEWHYTRKFMPTKPTNYIVKAIADQPKKIAEANEDNNVKSITISVKKALSKAARAASPGAKALGASPTRTINPAIGQLLRAKITSFDIGTDPDGRWFWQATVKNTGQGIIDARRLKLKTTQIKWGPANNPPVPGSVRLITQSIAPGASKTVKTHWERCCLANELSVDLNDTNSNLILDQTSIPNLIYQQPGRIFDKKIKRIEWDNTAKTWQATFQNKTAYYLKMVVQGKLIKSSGGQPIPVGGERMVIGPNQTRKSMKFHASNAVDGDKIKVSFYFDQSTYCTDSASSCGADRGNLTTVPNSSDFP